MLNLRQTKGSSLDNEELDENFLYLYNRDERLGALFAHVTGFDIEIDYEGEAKAVYTGKTLQTLTEQIQSLEASKQDLNDNLSFISDYWQSGFIRSLDGVATSVTISGEGLVQVQGDSDIVVSIDESVLTDTNIKTIENKTILVGPPEKVAEIGRASCRERV